MTKPDIPKDEDQRLKSLKSLNILDTPPEERFDRLTRLARRLFDVPIALVTLVDEKRQWFKSNNGLGVPETSRDISFCGHTILQDEIFIVEDTLKDQRFADNPLVSSDPEIRFYAGFPLKSEKGYKLGSLCIIDRKPREIHSDERQVLYDLAMVAQQELTSLHLATIDELTGITNRRGFISLARHSINLSFRQKTPRSLIFMDLDKFKPINDQFGHAEGDHALRVFSDIMKDVFRDSDLFARLGGDEFVALLTDTGKETGIHVMERFQETLDRYNRQSGKGYDILFSYGIVDYNPKENGLTTIEYLLEEGDKLMFINKNDRR